VSTVTARPRTPHLLRWYAEFCRRVDHAALANELTVAADEIEALETRVAGLEQEVSSLRAIIGLEAEFAKEQSGPPQG
jgi:uncharacterized protein YceH (UPF0502 family)